MEIRKYCLYENLDENIISKYSLFKLGDIYILDQFAREMAAFIKEKIMPGNDYFIYATNKYPTTIYCKKCSVLLAENIAKILKLPVTIAEYNYSYDQKTFYDNHIERKQIHKPHLSDANKEIFKNKKAIFIDDSIVTGLSLQVSVEELSLITDQIYAFTLVNIAGNKFSEQDINNFFEKTGNVSLVEIINEPGYVFTTHMMRAIDKLSKETKNEVFKMITTEKLVNFKKAFSVYFDKEFQQPSI